MRNDANMKPKWLEFYWQYMKNNTKKHNEKWCKNETPESHWPVGDLGPECRKRLGFPLKNPCQGFLLFPKSSTKQTSGKQLKKNSVTSDSHLARTWCAGRHSANLCIHWAHASLGPRRHRLLHGRSSLCFSVHFACRLLVVVFRVLSGFWIPFVPF